MIHFTCDLCGHPVRERRFVVQLEVSPAFDPEELTEADLEPDNLAAVAELLNQEELTGESVLEDLDTKSFRYDLCETCQARFVKDPLARDRGRRLKFSEN